MPPSLAAEPFGPEPRVGRSGPPAAPALDLVLARIRKVLCDPARFDIVRALRDAELSVNELAGRIRRAPAATSQHLRVLREMGLVEGTRSSTTIYYHLRPGPGTSQVESVIDAIERGAAASA
jgi:DNA-binding transcriptional ArsR family regulator